MRISIIILTLLICFPAISQDKEIKELFNRYDKLVEGGDVSPKDVFTENYLKQLGGEKTLLETIKANKLPAEKNKPKIEWQRGAKSPDVFMVKIKPHGTDEHATEFMVKKKDQKYLIEGNTSDAD